MEGRDKLRIDKYKTIMSVWNYDAICALTSLPVSDFENVSP
jgi:hypothetical protein